MNSSANWVFDRGIAQFKRKGKRGYGVPKRKREGTAGTLFLSLFDDVDSTSESKWPADRDSEVRDAETEAAEGMW